MKLAIESTIDNKDKLRIEGLEHEIYLQLITDNDGMKEIFLTPFEAQTIAGALLQMAGRLESHNGDVLDEDAMAREAIGFAENRIDYTIEKIRQEKQTPIGDAYQAYERTLHERIEYIKDVGGGIHKKLKMQNGLEILVTKDVWEKESHLQTESDHASPSYMNIKRDSEDNWYLVDCLPF